MNKRSESEKILKTINYWKRKEGNSMKGTSKIGRVVLMLAIALVILGCKTDNKNNSTVERKNKNKLLPIIPGKSQVKKSSGQAHEAFNGR